MAATLTTAELDTLSAMRTQARGGQIGYWQIYQWLADTLQAKGVSFSDSTVMWLRGATEANAGRGAMAELIRTYTATQYRLRYGAAITPQQMQQASNGCRRVCPDQPRLRNRRPRCHRCATRHMCGRQRRLDGFAGRCMNKINNGEVGMTRADGVVL